MRRCAPRSGCASRAATVYPQIACRPIVVQIAAERPVAVRRRAAAFTEILGLPARARGRACYAEEGWRRRAEPTRRRSGARCSTPPSWPRAPSTPTSSAAPTLGRARGRIGPVEPSTSWWSWRWRSDLETKFTVADGQRRRRARSAELLADDNLLLGLSDAGAHTSQLCDANYSTWLLGHWWRDPGLLTLEQAVWRLTGHPAPGARHRPRGAGSRPGFHADLVAFDPDTGRHRAAPSGSTTCPGGVDRLVAPSEGIEHVWVNGEAIWPTAAPCTGTGAGHLLRGGADGRVSRRDEILAVAKHLFARAGLRSTCMRDIAEANGLLAGSLYSHFRSKAAPARARHPPFYDELHPARRRPCSSSPAPEQTASRRWSARSTPCAASTTRS